MDRPPDPGPGPGKIGPFVLPNLVVIGAQKAGTTSLHRYLDRHPEVAMSTPKELNFFTSPAWNWWRGLDWYESHFADAAASAVRGESSPSYTTYPRETGIAERMHAVLPDARLIYLVRDPVDRMVSQYLHLRANGHELRSLQDVCSDPRLPDSPYVIQGRYHLQLSQFLERYSRDRLLVVAQEDLMRRRRETLRRTFGFLRVDPEFWVPEYALMANTAVDKVARPMLRGRARRLTRTLPQPLAGRAEALLARSGRPRLELALRRRLTSHFGEDADRLRRLTGREFGSWSV